MLHRRHGTRSSGAERRHRTADYYERARDAIGFDALTARPQTGAPAGSVAIVGAGLAGCAATWVARGRGFDVTLYDAAGRPGGRVLSSRDIVSGRILEEGAELIGLNHPYWIVLADLAGFALSVVTPEDEQGGGRLESPLILDGTKYDADAQKHLYAAMNEVFQYWIDQSTVVKQPWAPWTTPNAKALDSQSLAQNIPPGTPVDVIAAIETEFELNNTTAISDQSWLANLAQFQAGGGKHFFDDTEIFRCAAGNQQLATWLADGIPVIGERVTAIDTSSGVSLSFAGGGRAGPFDYVVVATSVAMWPSIEVDGGAFPFPSVNSGPAIKYLAPVKERFWIPQWLSPSGMSDVLGMTWEGTDNQADTAGFELTVFAGGAAAQAAIDHGGSHEHFKRLISQLYPGFSTHGAVFKNWPADPNIRTGYSCPAPGQVTGAQQSYTSPHNDRLFVAGEHTSPAWFGFMEGALESGIEAALRVGRAAGV